MISNPVLQIAHKISHSQSANERLINLSQGELASPKGRPVSLLNWRDKDGNIQRSGIKHWPY